MKTLSVASWSNILLRRVALVERKCKYIVKTGGIFQKKLSQKNAAMNACKCRSQLSNFNPSKHCQVRFSYFTFLTTIIFYRIASLIFHFELIWKKNFICLLYLLHFCCPLHCCQHILRSLCSPKQTL